jgi:hypothetical protein
MDDLIYMLKQAFEAGQSYASEYEAGGRGYHPDFLKWIELNKDEIQQLRDEFNITEERSKPPQQEPQQE